MERCRNILWDKSEYWKPNKGMESYNTFYTMSVYGCALFPPALILFPLVFMAYPVFKARDLFLSDAEKYYNVRELRTLLKFCSENERQYFIPPAIEPLINVPREQLKKAFLSVYDCDKCSEDVNVQQIVKLMQAVLTK